MRWVPVEGWWPRLVAWACRHGVPGAKAYACRRIRAELSDELTGWPADWSRGQVLSALEEEER